MKTDPEQMRKNLLAWAELTDLCIELRKAALKAQTGLTDDDALTNMVFAEAVAAKERAWERSTASPNS